MAQVFEGLGGTGPWLGAGHTVRRGVGACLGDDEMRYRKKPVVIDAVQWFKMGDHPAVVEATLSGMPLFIVDTLEGHMRVTPGDWIITGVQGEHYPCKPDIFEMTYEPEGENT